MNKLIALIAIAAVTFSFSSCKKGEEDPSISFKSRDKRIQGEWLYDELTIEKTTTTVNITPFGATTTVVQKRTYELYKDGTGKLTQLTTQDGQTTQNRETPLTKSGVTLMINEDGSYTTSDLVEFVSNGDNRRFENEVTGKWMWGYANKNKSSINLVTTDRTTDPDAQEDFSTALLLGEFDIIGLSSDQLIIEQDFTNSNTDYSELAGTSKTTIQSVIKGTFRK